MNKTLLALAILALLFTLTFAIHHESESNSVSSDDSDDSAEQLLMGGWT